MKVFIFCFFSFLVVVILPVVGFTQEYNKYSSVPKGLMETKINTQVLSDYQKLRTQAYDLTQSLPTGFVKDGSVDYTSYLQRAVNKYTDIIFPDFPVKVNEKGISLRSNSNVLFNNNSMLVMADTDKPTYVILNIKNVNNLKIYFPKLRGDRLKHRGSQGEGGMGIRIYSSQNVSIFGPEVSNCWGDGIYIADGHQVATENIYITNAKLDYNRRNGISITGGQNISIVSALISNTLGTRPMSGIDIEPNKNDVRLDNITISDYVAYNNGMSGLQIGLSRLPGKKPHTLGIKIDNLSIYGGDMGIRLGGYYPKYSNAKNVDGSIIISNVSINDVKYKNINLAQNYHFGPKIYLDNVKFYQKKKSDNTALLDFRENVQLRTNIEVRD